MDDDLMIKCFNEWMRRFIEEPDRFEHEFETVGAFVRAEADGVEPSYGQTCTAYMNRLAAEVASA